MQMLLFAVPEKPVLTTIFFWSIRHRAKAKIYVRPPHAANDVVCQGSMVNSPAFHLVSRIIVTLARFCDRRVREPGSRRCNRLARDSHQPAQCV